LNPQDFRTLAGSVARQLSLRDDLASEAFDPKAALDRVENEADLEAALATVAASAREDEAMAEGLGRYIADLQSRKSRMENAAQHKRGLIIMAMERVEKKTIRPRSGCWWASSTSWPTAAPAM